MGAVVPPRQEASSPLTRGKLIDAPPPMVDVRLIPAHARKTPVASLRGIRTRAHPRSRGENIKPIGFASIAAGSSPLTRGKPTSTRNRVCDLGLIPVHAGKTEPIQAESHGEGAHPRSRGENIGLALSLACRYGSSPLTRGKLGVVPWWHRWRGLIPAHAGKTSLRASSSRPSPAHPRSRGE